MLQMNLRHYGFPSPFGAIAENLVNSYDATLSDPEHLGSPAALSALLETHKITVRAAVTARDLAGAKRLRTEVRDVFAADSQMAAVDRVAILLTRARVEPSLAKSGNGAHIVWQIPPGLGIVPALRSATAFNLAHLIAERGFDRLRVCDAAPCADVFLDVSKPGGQRFCGTRCATRTRVAAHRLRSAQPGNVAGR